MLRLGLASEGLVPGGLPLQAPATSMEQTRFLDQALGETRLIDGATEKPGDQIGHYRLIQEIGRGGCGVVYLAEQQAPVRRRVALKVIKLGMDTKQVVARFQAEQQALALMDHPSIAQVYDAGATKTGRPYFVMEWVQGARITEHCDQQDLSTAERLKLFVQVCHAIQHAHQKGVIHRDIKPSNILVSAPGGAAVAKVIDFGISKATQGRLTEQTFLTTANLFIGTPAYMSPEQVDLSTRDIDTRTDIYSLGVLLYELLVGSTPFAPGELLNAGLDGMRQIIREREPRRPSTCLRSLDAEQLRRVAVRRQTDSSRLVQQVRGDLDWIVMKCLEKERARRYETANGLAMDIQRYLAEEPILARPPSAAYRAQKFFRRNRAMASLTAVLTTLLVLGILQLLQKRQVMTVAVIASALVLGILWSTREAVRARKAELEQERSRRQAEAAREDEKRQRELAEAHELIARRRAYASEMIAAWQSFLDGDVTRTRGLLERQRPVSADQVDFRGFEWRYLWRQSRPDELFVLCEHPVSSARYFPDGRRVAMGRDDGLVTLADAEEHGQHHSFRASHSDVATVAISSDGQRLATASRWDEGEKVKLWALNLPDAAPIPLPGHRQEAGRVAFSPDGQRLVSVGITPYSHGIPPELCLWDVATAKLVCRLTGHQSWVRAAAFSPDSTVLATGDGEGIVKLWDVAGQKEICSLRGHQSFIGEATFSPVNDLLATADGHGTVILWNWRKGAMAAVWSAHRAPIYDLAISPDGRWVATASRDHTARLFEIETGAELAVLRGHRDRVRSIAFSPDGRHVLTAGEDVRVWRAAPNAGSVVFSPEKSTGTVGFSPDSRILVQELWNSQKVVFWDPSSIKPLRPSLQGRDVMFSPDGALFVSIIDGTLVLHESKTFGRVETISLAAAVTGPVAWSPDGKVLVVRRERQHVVIDVRARQEVFCIAGVEDEYAPVAFSPDSKHLFTAGLDRGSIRIWDTAGWTPVAVVPAHTATIEALAMSPDGQTLASGGHDRAVRLWNVSDGALAAKSALSSNSGIVTRLAFSPDGMTLAIGTFDGAIKLWSVGAEEEVGALNGHASVIRGLAFSPDGRMLASSSYDGVWRLWMAATLPETSFGSS